MPTLNRDKRQLFVKEKHRKYLAEMVKKPFQDVFKK
jgi:hypothetical protein